MNANEINKNTEKLSNLSSEQKEAILNLIDSKINNDMEKVLLKMDAMTKEFNFKIDSNIKEMMFLNKELNIKIDSNSKETLSLNKKLNTKIDSIKWFIVSAFTIIGLLIAIFKLFF